VSVGIVADAGKAGVGVGKDAASATRMSLDEAQKILGVEKNASLEEVLKVRLCQHREMFWRIRWIGGGFKTPVKYFQLSLA
jgi:hypothetical protein